MTGLDGSAWQRVSPLSVLFYVGQILRGVAKNLFQAVVPAAVFLISTGWTSRDRLVTLALALFLVLVLVSVGRYLRFRFRIAGDTISIRQGIFRREELDIAFARIQGINTTQNPVYRAFGLVDVKLDTAGSVTAEGHLPAVPAALGDALRQRIRQRRASPTETESAEPTAAGHGEQTLLTLSASDLVRVGLSSNRALILLAVLAPVLGNMDDRIERWIGSALSPLRESFTALTATNAFGAGLALFLAAAIVLVAISVIGAFLRFHGYTLTTDGEVLRSSGGLITTYQHSMGIDKLQVLKIRQSPILRAFGRFRLLAKQAASHAVNTEKSFLVPLAAPAIMPRAIALLYGTEGKSIATDAADERFRPISRRYVRSRTLISAAAVAAALVTSPAAREHPSAAVVFGTLAVALCWILVRRRHARWGLALSEDAVVVRRGFVGTTLSVFLFRKVQRVDIRQSPFQRRHGLVNVDFVLAAETVTVPWLDEQVARRLCDWVLYKVESSRLAWI